MRRALAAALALACASCGRERHEPGAIDAAPTRATRLVGDERRPALSPRHPRDIVTFDVPRGATSARLHVAAWRTGWWSRVPGAGGEAACRVVIEDARGSAEPVPVAARLWRTVDDARWSAADVALAPSARRIAMSCPELPDDAQAWIAAPVFGGRAPPGARNILLVSLDTVRADAVGAYGQAVPATPHLDALASRGTLFTRAFAPAPWTLPSHVSVMTGLMPSWHGRWDLRVRDRELPPVPTLAEILGRAGLLTAAFTGEGSISWPFGASRGFDLVVEHPPTRSARSRKECDASANRLILWLQERAGAPCFLFWHVYEPHAPYLDRRFVGLPVTLPPGVAADATEDWQRYLGDLAAADAALGRILQAIDDLGLRETTDVVVISDHGEEFGEHSKGVRSDRTRHGHALWDTLLHVPLVVVSPRVPPGRRDDLVSLIDLFPTILDLAGVPAPPSQGRSFAGDPARTFVAAEGLYPDYAPHERKAWREAGGLKHVGELASPPREWLFDTSADPLETNDLSSLRPADTQRMRADAAAFFREAPLETAVRLAPRSGEQIPPELLESLRALGYVK